MNTLLKGLSIFKIVLVVTHFWVNKKKNENEKIQKKNIKKYSKEIQKIIGARK
jgi:hypothetical protein